MIRNRRGLRRDVLAALHELNFRIIRYRAQLFEWLSLARRRRPTREAPYPPRPGVALHRDQPVRLG